jgi:ABC-2 type transport system permease protein
MQSFPVQLLDLTLIQLTNWRWSWRTMLLTGMLAPVLSTLALGVFAANSGPETLGYVLTGNMVLSLLFSTMDRVSGHFAYMRLVGRLDYFATLPIYRISLILATVFAFLLLSLPPVAVTLILGTLLLRLPLLISPWLIVVIPLITLSLCGLGALIGSLGKTPEEVGSLSMLATFVLVGLGPVIIPADRLPAIVNTISILSPATYAASALRQTVLGQPDRIPLPVDMLVLGAMMAGLLWLVSQRMDWRQME